jgi:hypothetical protein
MPSGPVQIVWQSYRPAWRRKGPPRHYRAVLVQREIGESGKPVMREIAYLAAFDESRLGDSSMRAEFWIRARFRLGKLRLRPNVIGLVEEALAKRVPMSDPGIPGWQPPRSSRSRDDEEGTVQAMDARTALQRNV